AIYYLFGRASTVPDYVICDEDMLEFLQSLQQEKFRPSLLFDAFRDNHLLLIGLHLADWLARFFLRAAKPNRLSDPRDVLEIVADRDMNRDHDLVLFLQHFSSRTQIYSGESGAFVDELWRRWRARNPDAVQNPAKPRIPPAEVMPDGAIFISYAREDLEAVRELKSGLDAEGLAVWFDMDRLSAGDAWDLKIRRNIQSCSLFIAVISVNTENREEGYFRREWHHAVERSWNMADDRPFIVPVIIDETTHPSRIPDRFKDAHMVGVPGGRVRASLARVESAAMSAKEFIIAPSGPAVDADNPWPGLSAFTEDLAPYFCGRIEEREDLFRRVKRKLLTTLFGMSGLGKTSLLQAGLFPILRREGYWPVPIRLDYELEAPELGE
ncbi:MAG: toll/interleukin-1 receptor domain-containing protein, partial [Aestuariivirga sp.]